MKGIILAAGEGIRLRPYTMDRPKCMVEFNGLPIIDYIINTMTECGIHDIIAVSGYKEEVLRSHLDKKVRFYTNPRYGSTNMLFSLFCAESELNDDIIISYADIIYRKEVLKALMQSTAPFAIAVDRRWRELWSLRMEDPLSDAETLKIGRDGNVTELGKKPASYQDIEGQYIGLIKISRGKIQSVRDYYHSLDTARNYDGKDFYNMFMTSFIQLVIDNLMPVTPVFFEGGWIEIDNSEDLSNYSKAKIAF